MEVVESFGFLVEPFIDRALGGEALRDATGFVFEIEDDFIGDGFVEFVGVDVGAEDFAGGFFVFAQEGGSGEADEDGVGESALHLSVHVAALGSVTFIDEDVEASMNFGRGAFEVEVEFVDEGTEKARGCVGEFLDKFFSRGDAGEA